MRTLQAANALLRSGASTCNALTRTTPILSSRIASPVNQSQLASALSLAGASHGLPSSRPFSSTSAQYKKKNKNQEPPEPTPADEEPAAAAVESQQPYRRNNQKPKFVSRASRDTPPKREREAAAAAAAAAAQQAAHVASTASSNTNIDPDRPFPDPENPFDFADLVYTFDKAEARHTSELAKITNPSTGAGSLAVETIGNIPVVPDRKNAPTVTYPLRELATIAPLGGGRKYSILAFEESSIKPIMSAVQTSEEFNQQPQKSEENPLELIITVDPERAEQLAKRVKDVCLSWRGKIRDVSHKREALHKKWKTAGSIVYDDLHRLKEKVQKLQDERMKVVLACEKEALAAVAKR